MSIVDEFPDASGEVAFGGSDGFFAGFAFLDAALDVVVGFAVGAVLGEDDGVEGPVGLPVSSSVEPVAVGSS